MPYMKIIDLINMPVFWFTAEYPRINEEQIMELAQDLEKNGQQSPILIWEDQILDGLNRISALQKTNLTEALVEYFEGTEEEAISKTHSVNILRRHLEKYQIAIIAEKKLQWIEKQTAERKSESARKQQNPETGKFQPIEEKNSSDGERNPQSRKLVADEFNVNPRYIQDARRLRLNAPDLHKEVHAGNKSLDKAIKELQARNEEVEKKLHRLEYGASDLWEQYKRGQITLDNAIIALNSREKNVARAKRAEYNEALTMFSSFERMCEERLREINLKIQQLTTVEQIHKALDTIEDIYDHLDTTELALKRLLVMIDNE